VLDVSALASLARSAHVVRTITFMRVRLTRGTGKCKRCGKNNRSPYRFSLKTGTIFEETKMPLRTWFRVLHLMLTSKKGISALQIHRMVGTRTYESAFYMCHRLRAGMKDPDFKQLMGIVEVDETFLGGKEKTSTPISVCISGVALRARLRLSAR
jgi:hypothetical protein